MSSNRNKVLKALKTNREAQIADKPQVTKKISEFFGENTFNLQKMQEYLPEHTFLRFLSTIKECTKIDAETVESIAKGLKKWALDRGATHYTHWFQPLTGATAEKHDTFFKPSFDGASQGIERLTVSELVQREADASSLPSGGLRGTNLARGYTIWDPSSPAFILESKNGKTLYIPAIFISHTGESLDYKTPLLKSAELLNQAATSVCHFFDENVKSVYATLGLEQEYFVIDKNFYYARPDLMLCGRTLFGANSPKGQQKEDHYFASIPERIQNFIVDFENEAFRVGIPVTSRHNEVAPCQYEVAPMFEELNVAIDHNLLLMEIMKRVGERHNLHVIFHEKPFAGINGSGKHNNWSLSTEKGKNLLSPTSDPGNNLSFLTFIINIIKAMNDYSDILRASIATPGNDHRLGANEAPPAIMSIYTGTYLQNMLNYFKTKGLGAPKPTVENIDLEIPKIPQFNLDIADRNRTSPFPFTSNKFEFRAVGSSANCGLPMIYLNTLVAHQLIEFKNEVNAQIKKGIDKQKAIISILQNYLKSSEKIIFNGDNYSPEWEKEATKRGLSNNKNMPRALNILNKKEYANIFIKNKIFNQNEINARLEICLEDYIKSTEIEMILIQQITQTHILPTANDCIQKLNENYEGLDEIGLKNDAESIKKEAQQILKITKEIKKLIADMTAAANDAHHKKSHYETALFFAENVKPFFEKIRNQADRLELLIDDDDWKLPKYREMLFIR